MLEKQILAVKNTLSQINFIPESRRGKFLLNLFGNIGKKDYTSLVPRQISNQIKISKQLLKEYNQSLYGIKLISENFGKLKPSNTSVSRLNFEKTGSELIPLGGKLNKFIIRKINADSFTAWKKAQDNEISIEPILRFKKTPDGNYRVITRYCGKKFLEFLNEHPESYAEIYKQKKEILDNLRFYNIEHGHTHENNFVVEMEHNKPIVRLIDFDQASISKKYN